MSGPSEVISLMLPNDDARSLNVLSKNLQCTPEQVLSTFLDALFEDAPTSNKEKKTMVRRPFRKKTCMPCVLKLTGNSNEITYKTASIVDFALGGIGLTIDDEHRSRESLIRDTDSFEVTLQIRDEELPTSFTCRTCYVHRNGTLRVGGALVAPDTPSLRNYFKAFMQLTALPSLAYS